MGINLFFGYFCCSHSWLNSCVWLYPLKFFMLFYYFWKLCLTLIFCLVYFWFSNIYFFFFTSFYLISYQNFRPLWLFIIFKNSIFLWDLSSFWLAIWWFSIVFYLFYAYIFKKLVHIFVKLFRKIYVFFFNRFLLFLWNYLPEIYTNTIAQLPSNFIILFLWIILSPWISTKRTL